MRFASSRSAHRVVSRSGVVVCASVPLALFCGTSANADLKLPAIIGDHMVLQGESEAKLWGWDDPGQDVTVTPSWDEGLAMTITTNDRGYWQLPIMTPDAGGPFTLTIRGSTTEVIRDVLAGEVWICSGQSNMEWPVRAADNPQEEISAANHPNIRLFMAPNTLSAHRRLDTRGEWVVCSPQTIANFSAVGYFFGRTLNEELDRPIGLISSDWGGTRVEAWTSATVSRQFAHNTPGLDFLDEMKDPNQRVDAQQNMMERWWSGLDRVSSVPTAWKNRDFDDSAWHTMALPQTLTGDLSGFDGILYYRKIVELPASWHGEAAILELGPIDDYDDVWVNGAHVGFEHRDGNWGNPRRYDIAENILREGQNVIAIRMMDTAGPGGINGQPGQMRLQLKDDASAEAVPLAGDWSYRTGATVGQLPAQPQGVGLHQNMPSVLFNGMINPLIPYTIKGVIWYQGESNRGNASLYADMHAAMIEDWRDRFGAGAFPFYFVQIAPFEYGNDRGMTAALREAQAHVAERVDNTGMVVTLDVGNPKDIHPRNKQTVGDRLARWALAKTYGDSAMVCQGPTPAGMEREEESIRIRFDHIGSGLRMRGEDRSAFLIAGADRVFYYADAVIDDDDSILVSSPSVEEPVAVRYAWSASPEAILFNSEGLPAAPFRTDDWSGDLPPVDNSIEMEAYRTEDPGFESLFNGEDLSGWVNVNTAPKTWEARGGVIYCTGFPTGLLRTEKVYRNFVLELEWRHLNPRGNAGLFVWSDALPVRGQPFTRSVEVQVMDSLEGDWYTSDGDIFPIHGATMTPENGRGGNRAFPMEARANDSPLWNHYRVECNNGTVKLAVNGKVVTVGHDCAPREGYICLEAEGSPIEFRHIRLKELPSTRDILTGDAAAKRAEGFRPLYTGVDFENWKFTSDHEGHWKVANWIMDFDGQGPDLWTTESFDDFELICDWRWTGEAQEVERPVILPNGEYKTDENGNQITEAVMEAGDSGIYLRGNSKSQINIWCWPVGSGEVYGYRTDANMPAEVRAGVTPKVNADSPLGEWNRFRIRMKDERLTVILNGQTVIENALLPGVPESGPIALQRHGSPIQFANIYIRELD